MQQETEDGEGVILASSSTDFTLPERNKSQYEQSARFLKRKQDRKEEKLRKRNNALLADREERGGKAPAKQARKAGHGVQRKKETKAHKQTEQELLRVIRLC